MKTLRLLSLCLIGSSLTLPACGGKDDINETGGLTAADDTETTGNTDFGEVGDGDGDEEGSLFVGDLGDGVVTCDPWAQDCPADEKCVAYARGAVTWDANRCVGILGDGQAGDPCQYNGAVESTDDCAAGTWCWDSNAEGIGTCTSLCTGSPDSPICAPSTSCSIANTGSINLCLVSCNPLLQDCSNDGAACFFDGGNFVCANATSEIPAGEPCGFINDCIGGTICLAPESFPNCNGESCCGEFCDLGAAVCSIGGTECTAFFEEGTAPPGYEDIGVCVVPG